MRVVLVTPFLQMFNLIKPEPFVVNSGIHQSFVFTWSSTENTLGLNNSTVLIPLKFWEKNMQELLHTDFRIFAMWSN